MPSSPPRGRRRERIRGRILDAARGLLLERGLDGFSLREVARRADYTPGALYTYFASVDDLLAALGIEGLSALGSYLGEVGESPPAERAVSLGEAYLRFAAERPEEYEVVFDALVVPGQPWSEFARVAYPFTMLVETFAEGVRQGAFAARPGFGPAEMAYGLWCLADGTVSLGRRHLALLADDLTPVQIEAMRAYVRGLSA